MFSGGIDKQQRAVMGQTSSCPERSLQDLRVQKYFLIVLHCFKKQHNKGELEIIQCKLLQITQNEVWANNNLNKKL